VIVTHLLHIESETELELDPDQLENARLTAADILEGEFERKEMHRGERLRGQ
jgi:hypothetical protein